MMTTPVMHSATGSTLSVMNVQYQTIFHNQWHLYTPLSTLCATLSQKNAPFFGPFGGICGVVFRETDRTCLWQDLVIRYMRMDLTSERDGLIAISRLSRFFFDWVDDDFMLPLPYPHPASATYSTLRRIGDKMRDKWRHIGGLVVQSRDDEKAFVRIGRFSLERIVAQEDARDFAVIDVLRKYVPAEENEFEVKLRKFAEDRTDMTDEDLRSDPATKGQWATVRLV
ncbi:hypothetical protein FAVG1_06464 [Fusarium avenaceum]|nr:hypothetical protein FAVG1_06464 [Fusarium avenaceum]